MKRKILAFISVTAVLALSSVSVMAQTEQELNLSEQTAVISSKSGKTREIDKNIIMGTVVSCNSDYVTIQTSAGRHVKNPGENQINTEESVQAEIQKENQTLNEAPPEKPDGEQIPQGEEKTVLITDSTEILIQNDDTQTQAQLSNITEGMMIKVELTDESDSQSQEVTAQNITVSEQKERPDRQQRDSAENQSSQSEQLDNTSNEQ